MDTISDSPELSQILRVYSMERGILNIEFKTGCDVKEITDKLHIHLPRTGQNIRLNACYPTITGLRISLNVPMAPLDNFEICRTKEDGSSVLRIRY